MESYIVGVENRLDEHSNFKDWALTKIADQDRKIIEMQKKMNVMKVVNENVMSRTDRNDAHGAHASRENVSAKMT